MVSGTIRPNVNKIRSKSIAIFRNSMNQSLQARLYQRLEQEPDSRALAFYDVDGLGEWISYKAFYSQASRMAVQLKDLGLQRGDVCIIVLPSNEYSATAILAVLLLGGLPLLVAPPVVKGSLLDLPRILKHTVRKTNARLVLCAETMAEMRAEFEDEAWDTRFVFGQDELGDAPEVVDLPRVYPEADDVAMLQLTSGTTGFPRVCMWSQEGVLAALDGMEKAMKFTKEDVCFNWTPLYHDMGLINNFMLCLTYGMPLVLFSPHEFVKRPALWLRGLHDTGATITWSPNFGYAITAQRARERQLEGVRLDHVRTFWNAAERIHHDTIQAFYERFKEYGVTHEMLKTNFGCAENVGGATFTDVDGTIAVEFVDRAKLFGERIAVPAAEGAVDEEIVSVVSAGRPHPDMKIHILGPDEKPLPEGHVGEVALETPSRLLRYMGDPESTEYALVGEWLRTGDLGYQRNNELFWVGRVKERITIRGKKLDPSDFEPVLFDVEGLRQGCFVVFGVDDEKQGTQHIVLVSEVREPLERSLEDIKADILKQVFLRLAVSISKVELVRPGVLAKTSSGKRRHRHFREMYVRGELDAYRAQEPAEVAATS